MSDNLKTVVDSLNQDQELRERVLNASSNDERKQILQGAGLPLPTQEEVQNHEALADVSGAGNTKTYVTSGMKVLVAFA
jgi:hypothetical protein